ncbi:MAG: LytTR family DNA-binding domain-containing protein [Pseudomonadota bacterium]
MAPRDSISNGTVFGIWPLGRSLPVIAGVLVTLFVVMKPEASLGLNFFERGIFWILHVGIALIGLLLASWLLLPRVMSRVPLWLALLVTGLAGAAMIVPVLYAVELMLPPSMQAPDDDWLDGYEQRGYWHGLLSDYIEATPPILMTWLAINLPLLIAKPELKPPPGDDGPPPAEETADAALAKRRAAERREFLQGLPKAIGTDILAISSDLHYLHVHTELGRCMVLGSLQRVADAMGDDGMRVHRAHWVARGAVVRLVRNGTQWECLLSNGLKVPVSRRNRNDVAAWFGRDANVVPMNRSGVQR